MRETTSPMMGVQALYLDVLNAEVGKRLRLPTQAYMALSDAKLLDAQAGAETFGSALLADEVPYSAVLKSAPTDRIAANPINVTAMMRVGGRPAKESLARAAAAILKRASMS